MTGQFEDNLRGWDHIEAEIAVLLSESSQAAVYASATAFVAAARSIPPPDEVGLGYWRTSIRLIWPNCEVEVFSTSMELYRLHSTGTDIATIPFQSGDELLEDWVRSLAEPDRISQRTPDHSPIDAKDS